MKNIGLIIGTSKSKKEDAYYIKSTDKFWGLIYESGLSENYIQPEEYRKFNKETGIDFYELAQSNIIKNDKQIKNKYLVNIQEGIVTLLTLLNKEDAPDFIVFNGLTSASWFFEYLDKKYITKKPTKFYNKKYPAKFGQISIYNKTKIFVLPNTSGVARGFWIRYNGQERWIEFWKYIKEYYYLI